MTDSTTPVLIDSSAWIAYFAPEGHQALKDDIREALGSGRVHTCAVVVTELLVGARNQQAFDKLKNLLSALPNMAIDDACWQQAAQTGFSLRKKGRSIPLPDLLIAAVCRKDSLELWHLDQHYHELTKQLQIRHRSYL